MNSLAWSLFHLAWSSGLLVTILQVVTLFVYICSSVARVPVAARPLPRLTPCSNTSWTDFPQIFIAKVYAITMLTSITAPRDIQQHRAGSNSATPPGLPSIFPLRRFGQRPCSDRDCPSRAMHDPAVGQILTTDTEANNPYLTCSLSYQDQTAADSHVSGKESRIEEETRSIERQGNSSSPCEEDVLDRKGSPRLSGRRSIKAHGVGESPREHPAGEMEDRSRDVMKRGGNGT